MTENLKQCLEAGDVLALFPLLKDWPRADLQSLLDEIESLHSAGEKQIDAAWQKEAFKPENFLSRRASKALDEAKKAQYIELLAVCSEISSVALYYLEAK